jgi:hypothetical protein
LLHSRRSAMEIQVLYAIYSRQAQAASVIAADLQLAERPAGEDVEAFGEPQISDDHSILANGEIVVFAGLIGSDVRQIVLLGSTVVLR